jgi:LAS superfamily LD-carboxypeptidase LdcB
MRLTFLLLILCQWSIAQENIVQMMGIENSHLSTFETHKLTSKTATAFSAMQTAALKDGIDIQLVSAYRSFERQQDIWEYKFERYTAEGLSPEAAIARILKYSTIPGTSRHHWGTDIDITDGNVKNEKRLLVPSKFHNNGPFAALHKWMQENAQRFGFYLIYTKDAERSGFSYEPWHYSYLPEAEVFLAQYDSRIAFAYFKSVGVKGSDHIDRDFWDDYYHTYVKGIDTKLIED